MKYKDYSEYVAHQQSKLSEKITSIKKHDGQYEKIVFDRYKIKGRILCLAARLGGEVRGFKKGGADAIGIDLNPGENNKDVIKGDVHDIPFKDNTFDYVFTNSIDHVLYLDKMFKEVIRVLKPSGIFIIEVHHGKPGVYEVRDTEDDNEISKEVSKFFTLIKDIKTKTKTSLLNGNTTIYYYEA